MSMQFLETMCFCVCVRVSKCEVYAYSIALRCVICGTHIVTLRKHTLDMAAEVDVALLQSFLEQSADTAESELARHIVMNLNFRLELHLLLTAATSSLQTCMVTQKVGKLRYGCCANPVCLLSDTG